MIAATVPAKTVRPGVIFLLAFLAVLSLAFVWRGVGRMLTMRTQAASTSEFAALTNDAEAKVVLEITEAPPEHIRGKLLERKDETHYSRTAENVDATWNKQTAIVMGKAEDIKPGAVVHVTGKMAADHSVEARQIVVLTGYVQVK
jgi:hypothetical protein